MSTTSQRHPRSKHSLPGTPPHRPQAALLLLIAVSVIVSACDRGGPGPAVQDGAGATATTAPAAEATATDRPEATATSVSAALATEVAGRDLPRYVRSVGRNGFEDGQFQLPSAMDIDDEGRMYVLDTTGIQVFDPEAAFLRRLGGEQIVGAQGLAVSRDGTELYVSVRPSPGADADAGGASVVVLDSTGDRGALRTLGQTGVDAGQLRAPSAVALGPEGLLFVADSANRRVEVFTTAGVHQRTIGGPGEGRGQFTSPRSLAFDNNGRLIVGQGDHFLLQRFERDGTYVDTMGKSISDETLFRVGGLAVDPAGRVYVSRAANHYLQVFAEDDGRWLGDIGSLGRSPAEFNTPLGMVIHQGQLYVVDQQNHRVQVFELPTS